MTDTQIRERLVAIETETKRLPAMEASLTILPGMAADLKHVVKAQEDHEGRIRKLEEGRATDKRNALPLEFARFVGALLAGLAGGVGGAKGA